MGSFSLFHSLHYLCVYERVFVCVHMHVHVCLCELCACVCTCCVHVLCVYAVGCVCVRACTVCVQSRDQPQLSLLRNSPLCFEMGSLSRPGAGQFTRLVSLGLQGSVCLPLQIWNHRCVLPFLAFLYEFWGSNLGRAFHLLSCLSSPSFGVFKKSYQHACVTFPNIKTKIKLHS